MGTKTETKPTVETKKKPEVTVTSNAKVVSAIRSMIAAVVTVLSAKSAAAQAVRSEADRLKYSENQARRMVELSWREASGFTSTDSKAVAAFDLRARPDVAKIMRLAYPVDASSTRNLSEALKHNAANGSNGSRVNRIGENRLLEIARGNLTFKQAIAGTKPARRQAKVNPKANAQANTSGGKLTPQELVESSFIAIKKQYVTGKTASLTVEQVREIFDKVFSA